jgi:drug/metabolite transporter (DMT)-like permease
MSASPIRGLAYAACGFALLSCGDAVIKSIAGHWPGTAVAALRYSFGAMGLGVLLWMTEGRAGFRVPMLPVQIGRAVSVSFASICFFLGIFLMPLAEATVIQFIVPMLTALLSAIFLKEAAPKQAWVATALAFAGVLVVLRPNIATLGLAALLPLCAAFGMACLMLFNRKAAGVASVLAMQFLISAFATPFLIGAAIAGHFSGIPALAVTMPSASIILRCAIVGVSASGAHALIYMATTRASAAVIAPMVYIQLLVAVTLGAIFFGNRPDGGTFAGATLVIGGGLYLWHSQRVRTVTETL